MTAHRFAHNLPVVALPVAAMATTGGHSVISTPRVGTAVAEPSVAGPIRRPDVKSDVLKAYSHLPLVRRS